MQLKLHLHMALVGNGLTLLELSEEPAVIRHRFIPALIGRSAISDVERELLSLPTRLGGIPPKQPSLNTRFP